MKRIWAAWVNIIKCLVLLILGPTLAYAAEPLEWQGFLTTGLALSDSDTPYLLGINKKARFSEETFVGLNLSKKVSSEWRIAAQLIARAAQADSALKADWAFVSYEPNNTFSATLGKQKIPLWMMSSYLDIGRAYPWVIPPEEVYTLFDLRSYTGAAAVYTTKLGAVTLTIRPYGGDVNLESSPNSPSANSKFHATNMAGGAVEFTLDEHMLRFGYNRALWRFSNDPLTDYGDRNYVLATVGIKTEAKGFGLLAEYVSTEDEDNKRYQNEAGRLEVQAAEAAAANDNAKAGALAGRANLLRLQIGGSRAYYATITKQMASFLAHLTYASVKRPVFDWLTRDQKSLALGLNYDVNDQSVVKAEVKRVSVPEGSQGIFDAIPESKEARIYRLSYSMIF